MVSTEAAWEMKLGMRVAAIRSTGKYIQNDPQRRQTLEKLGFVWRMRQASQGFDTAEGVTFDQFYDALKWYDKLYPDDKLDIPHEFVVPSEGPWPDNIRGLPLGMVKASKLDDKAFLKSDPDSVEKLAALGLSVKPQSKIPANDARFQKVLDGLKRYKEIHGDLLVPQPFVIPEDSPDWPEETWGLRLGARVNAIRSQGTFVKSDPDKRQMLNDIGFVWDPPQSQRRKRGRESLQEDIEEEDSEIEVQNNDRKLSGGADGDDQSDLLDNIFGAGFDFDDQLNQNAGDEVEENAAPTWGLEAGRDPEQAFAAREEFKQPDQDDWKPPLNLEESLNAAAQRAEAVGIIEPGG
jgi:hypothetical protein